MADTNDLWGEAFAENPTESAPIVLLNDQAAALTLRTGDRIEGVVVQETRDGTVWASLYARVPSLQNYMHKLVTTAYPVTADPSDPSPMSVKDTFGSADFVKLKDMNEFRSWLAGVLSSKEAHSIISNLLRFSSDRAAS